MSDFNLNLNTKYNKILTQFLKEEAEKLNNEQNKNLTEDGETAKPKITPELLVKNIMVMQPAQVLTFIKQITNAKSGKEFIAKNSPALVASIIKNGFYKAVDLAKSIKDINKKNIEDNSNIDFENVTIDEDSIKTIYVFDGDSIKKLESFLEEYNKSLEGTAEEAEESGKKLKDDVKKAKVKVNDETLDNNGLTVAGVIKNPENKKDSPKELEEKIQNRIETKQAINKAVEILDSKVEKSNSTNKTNDSKDDLDDYKKRHTEISKIEETISKALKNKLGKDYQSSLNVKIYPTSEFKKMIQEANIAKLTLDAVKARYTLGVRIDFFGDESDTVIEKDEEPRYVTRLIKNDEKNPGIKKITDTFKSVIQSNLDTKYIEKKLYAYLKYWRGDNPDANFDSIFIFAGYTQFNEPQTESLEQPIVKEADTDSLDFDKMVQGVVASLASSIVDANNPISGEGASQTFTEQGILKTRDKLASWVSKAAQEYGYSGEDATDFAEEIEFEFDELVKGGREAVSNHLSDNKISKDELNYINKVLGISVSDTTNGHIDTGINIETEFNDDTLEELNDTIAGGVDAELQNLMDSPKPLPINAVITKSAKALDIKPDDLLEKFGRTSKSGRAGLQAYLNKYARDYSEDPEQALEKMAKLCKKLSPSKREALAEIICKLDPDAQEKFEEVGIDINGTIDVKGAAKGALRAVVGDSPEDALQKAAEEHGEGRVFNYLDVRKTIDELEDQVDLNGKVQTGKLEQLASHLHELEERYQDDPEKLKLVLKCKSELKEVCGKLNISDNDISAAGEYVDEDNLPDSDTAKDLVDDEQTKEATQGFLGKLGGGLKAFFQTIAVAKILKFVLNHGKTFTDTIGAQVVKFKEDKNIIAEVTCILDNGEDSDSNYSDTKFSFRFDLKDLKWHATNLDNRKMKISNEDALIKKIFEVPEVKEFKRECLEAWSKLFDPNNTTAKHFFYFVKNFDKLKFKNSDKNMKKYLESLIKISDNFDKIKKEFEG